MIWALLSVAALAAAAVVTRPWWRASENDAGVDRARANVEMYRQRLVELQIERDAGSLAAGEFDSAKAELGQRLLEDADPEEGRQAPAAATGGSRWPPLLSAALVVVVGLGAYALSGQWRLLGAGAAAGEIASHERIDDMIGRLEQRLASDPSAEGFALLARSYGALGRYQASARAYAEANRLSADSSADWLTDEAEALALASDNDWRGTPRERLRAALNLAPAQPKALFYAGLAAVQAGDSGEAVALWRRLLEQPDLPQDVRTALRQRLAELDSAATPSTATQAAAPPPGGEETNTAPVLRLRVDLAPRLREQAQGRLLFVFAQAPSGPPMPLAVQRLSVSRWPVEVVLDDSMAMMPSLRLSQFDRWTVTARVSADGDAPPGPGDLQVKKTIEASSIGERIDLLIDEVLQ